MMSSTKSVNQTTAWRIAQWYEAACKRVRAAGYHVSAGSWIEAAPRLGCAGACVFSVEDCGPATYGHPQATIHLLVSQVKDGA